VEYDIDNSVHTEEDDHSDYYYYRYDRMRNGCHEEDGSSMNTGGDEGDHPVPPPHHHPVDAASLPPPRLPTDREVSMGYVARTPTTYGCYCPLCQHDTPLLYGAVGDDDAHLPPG
jgi:hypothetical protein